MMVNTRDMVSVEDVGMHRNRWAVLLWGLDGDSEVLTTFRLKGEAEEYADRVRSILRGWLSENDARVRSLRRPTLPPFARSDRRPKVT
jgi:hypothetical protein